MTAETELLLINASRAQLVREVIRPSLAVGEIVLCDRFYDSTIAYQGYGRGLDLVHVHSVIRFAIGETIPSLTLLLRVPLKVSEARRAARGSLQPDRFEDADREFFLRVERGYDAIAQDEPQRVKVIDARQAIEDVEEDIWREIQPLLPSR
jgi:dTMP kinase